MKKSKGNFEIFTEYTGTGVVHKNRSLKRSIIRFLDINGNSTITELSKELNTSIPKTTSLLLELMNDGLIQEQGKLDSTGGRRASMYGLNPEACFFVGVDIKKYHVNFGLMDFKKQMISHKDKVPFVMENTIESLNRLIELISRYISEFDQEPYPILGLGINLSGRINTKTGQSYSFYHFQEEAFTDIIQNKIGIPTSVENDSRAMALGEFFCGDLTSEKNVIFINLDYGLGMGAMIDGKIYYGKSGFSGEIGHIPIFENEILCHCGKKGCLETEASGYALVRKFRERIKQGSTSILMKKNKSIENITLNDIMESALNEDTLSIEVITEIGEKLGKGLSVLINIFNPELLILGGTLSEAGDYIRLPARSIVNRFSLSLVNNDTNLRLSKLGEKAGVIGGCLIARNKMIKSRSE